MEHMALVASDKAAGDELADDPVELFQRHLGADHSVDMAGRDGFEFTDRIGDCSHDFDVGLDLLRGRLHRLTNIQLSNPHTNYSHYNPVFTRPCTSEKCSRRVREYAQNRTPGNK